MAIFPALLALLLSGSPGQPASPLEPFAAAPVDPRWQVDCADVRALIDDLAGIARDEIPAVLEAR